MLTSRTPAAGAAWCPRRRCATHGTCHGCLGRARLVHLLWLSGHKPDDIARGLTMGAGQVAGALGFMARVDGLTDPAREIIAAWGPLEFDLTAQTVSNLRALTHVPVRLVRDKVEAVLAASRADFRLDGCRGGRHPDGLLTHARIAELAGMDERWLKRALGYLPDTLGRRGRARQTRTIDAANGGARRRRYARAISLENAWAICRAIAVDPVDIPGL